MTIYTYTQTEKKSEHAIHIDPQQKTHFSRMTSILIHSLFFQ